MVIVSKPEAKEMLGNEDLDVDIISNLPESILCQILKCLPTKNAVATSILSKRWSSLSPFTYPPITLDLDDSLLLRPVGNVFDYSTTSFRGFMDKLLFVTLHDVRCVESVTLKCTKNYGDADIISWVSAVLRFNVRNLVLVISVYVPKTLFDSLNGCVTLVRLDLVMDCCELLVPDNFSLPILKRLSLSKLEFDNSEGRCSINELISGCPMLEELEMIHCNMEAISILSIHSPLLKNLCIIKSWNGSFELKLHAPNLEIFMLDDYVVGGTIFSTFNSLNEAYIDFGSDSCDEEDAVDLDDSEGDWACTDVARIIGACSNTKSLYLSEYSILSLYCTPLQLPQFRNLIWLILGSVRSNGWMILAGLLSNAPNLERLTFIEKFKQSETGFADFKRLVATPLTCLELHIKIVDIRDFEGNEDEFKLLNFFLHNGKVLENVQVRCSSKMNDMAKCRLFMMEGNTKIVVQPSPNE